MQELFNNYMGALPKIKQQKQQIILLDLYEEANNGSKSSV
jgi:hypothetical protein